MDLGDLIILLFFVLPVISRLLGARKKPRQIEDGSEGTGESAFERAIREIERALDESQHEERKGRLPQPDDQPVAERPPRRVQRKEHQRKEQAGASRGISRRVDAHDPFHDVAPGSFESKQYKEFIDKSSDRFDSPDYREFRELTPAKIDESLFDALVPGSKAQAKGPARLRKKLRGKQTIREAYAIAELLGPPRALNKRKDPRHR